MLVILHWGIDWNYNIFTIIMGWIGRYGLVENDATYEKKISIFKWYMGQNEMCIVAHTGATFPSGLCILQMAMRNKKWERQNYFRHCFKRLCLCSLLCCSVEDIKIVAWTRKKGRKLFQQLQPLRKLSTS